MRILEKFLCGKENNINTCEDGLFIAEKFIAIIDGVTSKSSKSFKGKRSGLYAKEIICRYLKNYNPQIYNVQMFNEINNILREEIQSIDEKVSEEDFPRASIIIYNDIYKEIWVYGDCQCSINGKIYTNSKKIDELNSELRSFYLEYEIINGKSITELMQDDIGRKKISNNLLMQFSFENKLINFGYPVLNGTNIEESMIKVYSVRTGDEIILASDGYPFLKSTLEDSEKELKYLLENDPMCFKIFKSTKGLQYGNISFDDRTFCKFIV